LDFVNTVLERSLASVGTREDIFKVMESRASPPGHDALDEATATGE